MMSDVSRILRPHVDQESSPDMVFEILSSGEIRLQTPLPLSENPLICGFVDLQSFGNVYRDTFQQCHTQTNKTKKLINSTITNSIDKKWIDQHKHG